MSTVTITSRPTRITVTVRGTQGRPGPMGTISPQLEALRDQVISDAASAAQSAQGAGASAGEADGAALASAAAAGAAQESATAAESARDESIAAALTAAGEVTRAQQAAAAADASATTAGTSAQAASAAADGAGQSATAAAASESQASGSAEAASESETAAAASSTAAAARRDEAAASATAASASAGGAATSAAKAAALASGEYTVFIDDDIAITNGGYPVTRSVRYATTLNRFYAEVMSGTSMVVTVEKNGVIVHGPVAVSAGQPVTQVVNIPIALGDRLTYNLVSTAKRVWLSLDGVIA